MKIYKFFKFGQKYIDSINNSKVWLGAPTGFNDMDDCKISMIGKISSDGSGNDFAKINECLEILYSNEYSYPNPLQKQTINDLRTYIQEKHSDPLRQYTEETSLAGKIIRSINTITLEKSGVACFSGEQSAKSDLMWAHYADNHRGFCVEYEYNNNEDFTLLPVTYSNNPLKIKAKEFLFAPDEQFERLLTTKTVEWSYENEWRIVVVNCLEGNDFIKKGKLIDLPKGISPKRLITGHKFEENKNSHHKKALYENFENTKTHLKTEFGIVTVNYKDFIKEGNQ